MKICDICRMTSDKPNVSLLADILIKKGLSEIIISPGSRNAPIVLAFAGRKEVRVFSIVDERSAAFFALGMAQQTGKTVAIACTSGSAVLNYSPAIAEAFYQKIPLLVLTADRPPELIDQGDGQTIRQKDVYKNYIKKSFELPVVVNDPATFQIAEQVINRAYDETMSSEDGPVHINIPLREPLYEMTNEQITGRAIKPMVVDPGIENELVETLAKRWNGSKKVLIIAGQMPFNSILNGRLKALSKLDNVVVLTETTSNLVGKNFIDCIDAIVSTIDDEHAGDFQPDLLLSIGGQIVSKMVKKFLRLNPPKYHWHVSPAGEWMDTYFVLNKSVTAAPVDFLKALAPKLKVNDSDFAKKWHNRKNNVITVRTQYLKESPFSDLKVFDTLLKWMPENSNLHLGNSTPVRYSQLFGTSAKFNYHSNRGVSGIDGQVSTAAGAAYASDKINTIITGDLGFFYDSNALMNHHLTPNLKIIVINNGGGGIFKFISGPDKTPYLEDLFVTKHSWSAEKIAEAFNINYFKATGENELETILPKFYATMNRPALLEIFTPSDINSKVLKGFFKAIKDKTKTHQ